MNDMRRVIQVEDGRQHAHASPRSELDRARYALRRRRPVRLATTLNAASGVEQLAHAGAGPSERRRISFRHLSPKCPNPRNSPIVRVDRRPEPSCDRVANSLLVGTFGPEFGGRVVGSHPRGQGFECLSTNHFIVRNPSGNVANLRIKTGESRTKSPRGTTHKKRAKPRR